MATVSNQVLGSSDQITMRNRFVNPESHAHHIHPISQTDSKKIYSVNDRTVESFVYLYFLVSIGFIMAVMYFISPNIQAESATQHEINLEIFCSCTILLSIIWMFYFLCRQQKPNVVQFTDFPKRYCRPLLICVYLFGITCIVTDAITMWILLGCIKMLYFRFTLALLKMFFTIFLVVFLKKYSSAILFNVKIPLFHVIGTCICLMLRTALGNSRPLVPKSLWWATADCVDGFINPALSDDDQQYIIAFDQELYITAIVMLLIIWTNVKVFPGGKAKEKPLHFMYQNDEQFDRSLDTSMQSELSRDISDSQVLSEAVQKEPNVDMGLVFGLTFGGILSIPYTFWWEKNFLTDKRIELFTFHMIFVVLMLLATLLAGLKLRNIPIPRLSGISFPVTVLLFVLLFCCAWYSWFSIVASAVVLRRSHFGTLETLGFTDLCLFFLQVVFQTYLIIKAYSFCKVVLKPKSSNTIRQCVLFLMVCNFVLWIHVVYFDLNHKDKTELQVDFYGSKLWTIISKSTYPLCMYYRLFSCLCLFEICFLF